MVVVFALLAGAAGFAPKLNPPVEAAGGCELPPAAPVAGCALPPKLKGGVGVEPLAGADEAAGWPKEKPPVAGLGAVLEALLLLAAGAPNENPPPAAPPVGVEALFCWPKPPNPPKAGAREV